MTLTEARKQRGWTVEYVAAQIRRHGTTVARIERGELLPGRLTARALYELFEGDVSLASIFDPGYGAAESTPPKNLRQAQ